MAVGMYMCVCVGLGVSVFLSVCVCVWSGVPVFLCVCLALVQLLSVFLRQSGDRGNICLLIWLCLSHTRTRTHT